MSYAIQRGCLVECGYETFDEAVEGIKKQSSWDCRPAGGQMNVWYDAGSGRTYRIIWVDDEKDTMR